LGSGEERVKVGKGEGFWAVVVWLKYYQCSEKDLRQAFSVAGTIKKGLEAGILEGLGSWKIWSRFEIFSS
jgi:hypothetical protein